MLGRGPPQSFAPPLRQQIPQGTPLRQGPPIQSLQPQQRTPFTPVYEEPVQTPLPCPPCPPQDLSKKFTTMNLLLASLFSALIGAAITWAIIEMTKKKE